MLQGRLAKIFAGVAAVTALALGGAALAGATQGGSDEPEAQLAGPEADRAEQAALRDAAVAAIRAYLSGDAAGELHLSACQL